MQFRFCGSFLNQMEVRATMKLSSLVEALAQRTHIPPAEIAGYARQLREGGHIASGGRGPGGADMRLDDLANLLIGLYASPLAKTAPARLEAFRATPLFASQIKGEVPHFNFLRAQTFGECFTAMLQEVTSTMLREWASGNCKATQPNVEVDFHINRQLVDITVEAFSKQRSGAYAARAGTYLTFYVSGPAPPSARLEIRRLDYHGFMAIEDVVKCLNQ